MEPTRRPTTCLICFQNHPLRSCSVFLGFTVKQRLYSVRAHRYCLNCLSKNHYVKNCTVSVVCRKCRGMHHTLLHQDRPSGSTHRSSVQDRLTIYRQDAQPTVRRLQRTAQRPVDSVRHLQRPNEVESEVVGVLNSRQRRSRRRPLPLQRFLEEQAAGQATTHQLLRQMVATINRLSDSLVVAPVQGGRHVQARSPVVEGDSDMEDDEEHDDFDIIEPLL